MHLYLILQKMKKPILALLGIILFQTAWCQRYELWIETSEKHYKTAKNLGTFNDSILTLYSRPSFFFPSSDFHFDWNEVEELKIRNKSKNQLSTLIGMGIGLLSLELYMNSSERENPFGPIFAAPLFIGGGALAGYLVSSKKYVIPLSGKTPDEKSDALKKKIEKKAF